MLKCPNCGNTNFRVTRDCTQHLIIDGNEDVLEVLSMDVHEINDDEYQCTVCSQCFDWDALLKIGDVEIDM